MVEVSAQAQKPSAMEASTAVTGKLPERPRIPVLPPTSISLPPQNAASRFGTQLHLDTFSPVNQNGSFEFDRVIKSGYLQKRTQKTKTWKSIYLVYRPNTLSIYKNEKENKLRHKIYLSDLTAVTLLKDPKHKREHVWGLFSPSRNFHFQALSATDAQDWVDLIRRDARIEEEEEELFLASPVVRRESFLGYVSMAQLDGDAGQILTERDRYVSSSPEPAELPPTRNHRSSSYPRRPSQVESSGISANEVSDCSDMDGQRAQGASVENFSTQSPPTSSSQDPRPNMGIRNSSQVSGINIEHDPDRIIWQGWLRRLRSTGGVKQWKDCWAVLRPRNLILYKDESEYAVQFIVPLGLILNVVDTDPVSKNKAHCLQIITEEKSHRFCAHSEEDLVQCLGAFKSLLAKRKELEAKAAAASTNTAQ